MKTLLTEIKISAVLVAVFAILLGGVYPLVVWAGGQLLFPAKANGSLLVDAGGTVRGSALIAQNFSGASYFHPRPSAAGTGYDAAGSSGANLGPTSGKLAAIVAGRVAAYRSENALAGDEPVPADAVTASGSGLDPHISVANAEAQARRVARTRSLPLERILALVAENTEARDLGIFGEPRVNVVLLNRALDAVAPPR